MSSLADNQTRPFLYAMALGDSYAMKYEFVEHTQDKTLSDIFHAAHPKFLDYKVGYYTDDTQMSLANLELLLQSVTEGKRLEDPVTFTDAWLQAFKRNPRQGYSKHMFSLLSAAQTAGDFIVGLDPSRGITSGAAMRAGVFGLLDDIAEVKRLTVLQAKITHDTPVGVNAALAVALSVHFLHHGGSRKSLHAFITRHAGPHWIDGGIGKNEGASNGVTIVVQALNAVMEAKTLTDVMLKVVNNDARSDTDTVCAIAMIIASRATDIVNDIPASLEKTLENGTYGADYLKTIDRTALRIFPPKQLYSPAGGASPVWRPKS